MTRPTAAELLHTDGALEAELAEVRAREHLGASQRRAVDAVFRACDVVASRGAPGLSDDPLVECFPGALGLASRPIG